MYETWNTSYAPIFGKERAAKLQPGPWGMQAHIDASIRTPDLYFDVAEVDGKLVAFASGNRGVWFGRFHVHTIYVLPEFQGHGVGRRLMGAMFEHAQGSRAVRLQVLKDNSAALSFYERHGFSTICESWNFRHWVRIKIMEQKLDAAKAPAKGVWGYVFG